MRVGGQEARLGAGEQEAAQIDESGAVRSVSAPRWGRQGTARFQYIPFGGELAGERRFGPYLLPELVSVGWWWGAPRYAPFFQAELLDITPVLAPERR